MKIYYISEKREKRNTAGAKAPSDISAICRELGYQEFTMPRFPSGKNKIYQKAWLFISGTFNWIRLKNTIESGSIVIYQHPMYGNRLMEKMIPIIQKKKNAKFIVVIHDLESLRGGIAGVIERSAKTNEIADNVLLKKFDAVICHNEHMRQYLIGQGFDPDKLFNLDIFDYLTEVERAQPKKGKTPKPDELPGQLEGDFGLVWDGNSAETCAGNTGEYLKYNNPHKTSLYLASGMPVIVWSQAAIADFVIENGVGFAVDSLNEMEDKINRITKEEYEVMLKKSKIVGKKIRNGFYTKKCLERIQMNMREEL